jgi:predicted PurR-regulated permease PerM
VRVILELIRIIFLFVIIGGICASILEHVYSAMGIDSNKYGWSSISVFILFFVLFRNKLQFSGWYKGKGKIRLPKKVSQILIVSVIVLLIFPAILSFIKN